MVHLPNRDNVFEHSLLKASDTTESGNDQAKRRKLDDEESGRVGLKVIFIFRGYAVASHLNSDPTRSHWFYLDRSVPHLKVALTRSRGRFFIVILSAVSEWYLKVLLKNLWQRVSGT